MQHGLVAVGLCLGLAAAGPAQEVAERDILLARVAGHMSENLKRLPNYTCLQTIERSRRASAGQPFVPVDRVRLEVALVEGKEMFSWPGAGNFEDRELRDMVFGGAIGNGNFALHAKSVFMSGAPRFEYVGERIYDGRTTIRWNFVVPRERSGYTIRNGSREAVVGYHGSFWAERDTLDITRLEVHADDIPPSLEIVATGDAVEYGRARIGNADFLLPRTSELVMTDFSGESRNTIAFTSCRQYTGESVLKFDDSPGDTIVEREPARTIVLPPGLNLTVALTTPLRRAESAVGDAVQGVLRSTVKKDGGVLLLKGAVLHGRIQWLRESRGTTTPSYVIGLGFTEAVFANTRARFQARLTDIPGAGATVGLTPPTLGRIFGANVRLKVEGDLAAIPGILFARPGAVLLPRGLTMVWHTEPMEEEPSDPIRARNR